MSAPAPAAQGSREEATSPDVRMAEPRSSKECTWLYKILTPQEHAQLPTPGEWNGTQLDLKDGFIHLSTSQQLAGTLARFFSPPPPPTPSASSPASPAPAQRRQDHHRLYICGVARSTLARRQAEGKAELRFEAPAPPPTRPGSTAQRDQGARQTTETTTTMFGHVYGTLEPSVDFGVTTQVEWSEAEQGWILEPLRRLAF